MQGLRRLVSGYKEFASKQRQDGQYRFGELADGQSPKTMIISCSDSRVIPSQIFNVKPGDLFMVRNVANIAPPFEEDKAFHGTSAALEFAILGLDVEDVIVLGHSQCGGIEACAKNIKTGSSTTSFLDNWLSILEPIAAKVMNDNGTKDAEAQNRLIEQEAIKASLVNLMTFPFISERISDGSLSIHGAYFDLQDGQLYILDDDSGVFEKIE